MGCWTKSHHWQSHCVVSLSKTLYLLLSTELLLIQPRKTHTNLTEKIVDMDHGWKESKQTIIETFSFY